MQYGIEREIEILEYALRNEAAFVMYVGMQVKQRMQKLVDQE